MRFRLHMSCTFIRQFSFLFTQLWAHNHSIFLSFFINCIIFLILYYFIVLLGTMSIQMLPIIDFGLFMAAVLINFLPPGNIDTCLSFIYHNWPYHWFVNFYFGRFSSFTLDLSSQRYRNLFSHFYSKIFVLIMLVVKY